MTKNNRKQDIQTFHQENLETIAQINAEFGLREGIGGFMAKRRAKHALNKRVNAHSVKRGLSYALDGRFMNTREAPMDTQATMGGSFRKLIR